LPGHIVWCLTTTKAGEAKLFDDDASGAAAPLLSRCVEVSLVYDDAAGWALAQRAQAVARREGIDGLPLSVYHNVVAHSNGNMRRVLQRIESGAFKADAVAQLEREYEMCRTCKGPQWDAKRAELQAALAAAKR
jgi:hypothetical protein